MTKPGTKAKKAKSGNEVPLSVGSLSPKPNIMYIEANRYTENTTLPHSNLHTMNAFSSSSPLVENALKPPHNWFVSIDGQHSKVCKRPRLCVMLSSRSAQGDQEHLDNASPTSRDCRGKAAATAPQRVHGSQCGLTEPPFPMLHPSTQKAASRTAKKANAQGG